jgi:hypothetical protein
MEQMYLNISPCQLYLRLQGSAANVALLSTFGLSFLSLRVLFAQISGIPYESKRLALVAPDC